MVINTSKKFIYIEGVESFPNMNLKFDSIEVDDSYEMYAEMNMTHMFDQQGYISMKEFNIQFESNINSKVVPATGRMYYDMATKQIILNIAIVKNGNGFQYFFILDKIHHMDWGLGNIMSKKIKGKYLKTKVQEKDNVLNNGDLAEIIISDTKVTFIKKEETVESEIVARIKKDENILIYTRGHLFLVPTFLKDDAPFYFYYDIAKETMKFTKYDVYLTKYKE